MAGHPSWPMANNGNNHSETDKPIVILPGTVQKIIKPIRPQDPEKAQIAVEKADDFYRELRIENALTDENGDKVSLKPGAAVEVIVEADVRDTVKK